MLQSPANPASKRLRAIWAIAGAFVLLLTCVICATGFFAKKRARLDDARNAASRDSQSAEQAAALLASSASADETPAPPPHPPGENAADFLKNAFVLYNTLSDKEKAMLVRHDGADLDSESGKALFQKIQPIMDLIRRAAAAPYCDWGVKMTDFRAPFPHMSLALRLAQLARWNADFRFPDEPEGAVSDLAAVMQIGNSVGDAAMIGFLVDVATRAIGWDSLARNARSLTPDAATQVDELLQSPSAIDDLPRAMNAEQAMLHNMIENIANPKTRDAALAQLDAIKSFGDGGNAEKTSAENLQTINDEMRWIEQVEKDYAEKVSLPNAEFDAWWKQISDEAKSRPFAGILLPSFANLRAKALSEEVYRAMLVAGLNVIESGTDALDDFRDPMTGEPFVYAASDDGGFELRSKFPTGSKRELTLKFPAPNQE